MFVQFLEDIALVRKASVIPPEDKVKVWLNYCQLSVAIRLSAHIPAMWPIFVVVGPRKVYFAEVHNLKP